MPESYVVKAGDSLISIAARHGFPDWRSIYEHAANAGLRRKRPDPQLLAVGDALTIPDKTPPEFELSVNKRYVFHLKAAEPVFLRLALSDRGGRPYADKRYLLEVDGEAFPEARTDREGRLEQAVTPEAREARLTLLHEDPTQKQDCWTWTIAIGELGPLEESEGVRGHLANLGYQTGEDAQALNQALWAFQKAHKLPATGSLDPATRRALQQVHSQGSG